MKVKISTRILALVLMVVMIVPMFVFHVNAEDTVISFKLGNDGSATHKDGSKNLATYSETVDGYTLNITSGTNMYPDSIDAKGNGCIKFGASSKAGSCTFTVPAEVTSVKLYVAKYKTNTSKVTVNGTTTTLTKNSNDGAYDVITVDTTSTKTVSLTTVSGGYRAMLNTIEFVIADSGSEEPSVPQPSITILGEKNYLQVGGTLDLTADRQNSDETIAWTSSDTTVATVDANGKVTGKTMGTANITASVTGAEATYAVTVYPVEKSVVTVAEAIAIAKLAGNANSPYTYKLTGVVKSIEEYANDKIKLYVADNADATESIYVYNMAGGADIQAGLPIAITGYLMNYNEKTPEFMNATYELLLDDSEEAILEALNALELKMSLAYKYEVATEEVEVSGTVTDELNQTFTGVTGTSYTSWSNKTGESSAVYAGTNAGSNKSIQLNNNDKKPGIVTTASGGKITKITVTWNSNTADGRTLNIYGKNSAYSAATDLYDSSKRGTTLGTIVKGTSTSLTVSGDYEYIGIQSNSGAIYLDSISIEWEAAGAGEGTTTKEVCENGKFALRFGATEGLASITGVEACGLKVSAGGKEVYYTTTASSWTKEGGYCYVTVNLGNLFEDETRFSTKFTVQAYVVVDGNKWISTAEKTYSVADMVKEYYEIKNIDAVEHLYDYLGLGSN